MEEITSKPMKATKPMTQFLEENSFHEVDESGTYRIKVMGMLMLGYGYLLAVMLSIVALFGGLIWLVSSGGPAVVLAVKVLKFTWPLLLFIPFLVKALFVRIPKPEGHYLVGEQKQVALDFIAPICRAASGPKIHHIVVTDELNAAVQQIPKFGFFGPNTNYLILGVSLLSLMSKREVEAVVAHEFGHLSKTHGRLGAWTYRLRETLSRAVVAAQEKAGAKANNWGFKFFYWFYPKFDELTFALRRAQEYEADRLATAVAGTQAMGDALRRLSFAQPQYDAYWDAVWERAAETGSNGEQSPWQNFLVGVEKFVNKEASTLELEQELKRQADFTDTHPSLADRLLALGEEQTANMDEVHDPALQKIFGTHTKILLSDMDEQWRESNRTNWEHIHEHWQAKLARHSQLQSRDGQLDENEWSEYLQLTESIDGQGAARPLHDRFCSIYPEDAAAQFHRGRVYFEHDYAVAEESFLKSVQLDIEWFRDAQTWISHHYGSRQDQGSVGEILAEYQVRWQAVVEAAEKEREKLEPSDSFQQSRLDDQDNRALMDYLSSKPELQTVWILDKQVDHFSDAPPRLILLEVDYFHSKLDAQVESWLDDFLNDTIAQVPVLEGSFGRILDKNDKDWLRVANKFLPILRVPKAKIYSWSMFKYVFRLLGKALAWILATLVVVALLAQLV